MREEEDTSIGDDTSIIKEKEIKRKGSESERKRKWGEGWSEGEERIEGRENI